MDGLGNHARNPSFKYNGTYWDDVGTTSDADTPMAGGVEPPFSDSTHPSLLGSELLPSATLSGTPSVPSEYAAEEAQYFWNALNQTHCKRCHEPLGQRRRGRRKGLLPVTRHCEACVAEAQRCDACHTMSFTVGAIVVASIPVADGCTVYKDMDPDLKRLELNTRTTQASDQLSEFYVPRPSAIAHICRKCYKCIQRVTCMVCKETRDVIVSKRSHDTLEQDEFDKSLCSLCFQKRHLLSQLFRQPESRFQMAIPDESKKVHVKALVTTTRHPGLLCEDGDATLPANLETTELEEIRVLPQLVPFATDGHGVAPLLQDPCVRVYCPEDTTDPDCVCGCTYRLLEVRVLQ